ncbi:MAG TPA: SUMF1/EgtB/PvdO family nonheme iron enzyme [Solirubrobacterales bacterium]|nr:SUMF1/EgtB/PvdO family nonheme iron enzyme [Solirubrobacterales bacterium]
MPAPTKATDRAEIAERLGETRERTMMLVEQLDDERLNTAYSPLLSPLAWDLGHIASFEELWLVQTVGGREPLRGELGRLYDAIEQPRAGRGELPILRGGELRTYMGEVRERALDVLEGVEIESDDRLLRDGFVYELLIAHEQQHNETMLQLLQMIPGYEPPLRASGAADPPPPGPKAIAIDGGSYEIGAGPEGFAYDNERPRHEVEVAPFLIDRLPVTNADFAAFVAATGSGPPLYWERDGAGGWVDTRFGLRRPVEPGAPVIHVDHRQASEFAAWAGKRLPTELEWEIAAAGSDPAAANLDHAAFGTRPPAIASDHGAVGMLGDSWEWTATRFDAYPGFEPFPYREYSEEFYGRGYPVLRGGSWATRRNVIRISFRNWDLPERRQIFSGFRCAEDG